MTLKITKTADPIKVERVNICLYSQPGTGKTSMAFTAADPLLLDFDKGSYRAANRKDVVEVSKWADVESMTAADLAPYKTIIVDTAGRALDSLSMDIIQKNPKMGNGGSLSLKGFGELKSRFYGFKSLLNSFGKDLVLVCHMDEQRNGDEVIERLDAQGSSKNEIYKSVDAMGRIFVRQGKRYLDFSPREGSFGKNPGQFEEILFPPPSEKPDFLALVISSIKNRLNAMSEEQMDAQKEMEEWQAAVAEMDTLLEFNMMIEQVKKASKASQALFNKAAQAKGYVFNKTSKIYEEAKVAV